MKIHKEKLQNLVNLLYVREIVGKNLFQELHLYPVLDKECKELTTIATEFEICVLNKKDGSYLKSQLKEKILSIHNIALGMEKYRQSLLYFNENLELVDLF